MAIRHSRSKKWRKHRRQTARERISRLRAGARSPLPAPLAGSLPLIMPTPHAGFEHAVKLSRIQSKFDLTPYEAVAGAQPTMSRRKTHEPAQSIARPWTIGLARLFPAQSRNQRRAAGTDRRGRPQGHHLQSLDLREGDRRQHRLRRRPQGDGAGSATSTRARSTSGSPSRISRRRPTCCARSMTRPAPRRLHQHRGLTLSRDGHRGDDRRSAAVLARGRARQFDGQGAGHRGRAFPRSGSSPARGSTSTSPCCSRRRLRGVVEAYLAGLEELIARGGDRSGWRASRASS